MASILDPAEILQIHKDYADEFASLAQSGLTAAFSALSNSGIFDYHPARIAINFPEFGSPRQVGLLPVAPSPPILPIAPTTHTFETIPNVPFGSAPSPSFGNTPVYAAPSKPSVGTPAFNVTAPADPTNPTMPSTPSYLAMPDLLLPYPTINLPTAPTITQPIFEGRRPADISAPDPATLINRYTTERDAHRSMLPEYAQTNADAMLARYVPEYATLRNRINTAITDYTHPTTGGGVGVPSNIEGAIFARASDRNALEFDRAVDTAKDTIGKRGYFLPQGALAAIIKQSAVAMGDAQVRSSTEIATKNMELEHANFQFMLKLGEQLEEKVLETITQYLQLAVQMDAQAISAAKEIVATYLGAYNLQVMIYKAMWDGYLADAEVFKARIAALDSQVRVYEAQIKAELAKTEVNRATVDVLQAVASVNRALADTYRAQVDAATSTLEVSRIRTAIYESRVRAYASEVGAYEARWNAYQSEVKGELAKFDAFNAVVNSYVARVGGYKAQAEAYSANVTAVAETNRAIGATNESTIKVYVAKVDAALKNFDSLIAAYSTQSNVVIKQSEIEVEYWRAKANLIFGEFNAALNSTFEFAREQMNLFRGQMEAGISAGNGLAHAANVAGNLAGGAMSGLTSFAGTLVNAEQ